MRLLGLLLLLGLAWGQGAPEVWLTGDPIPSSFIQQAAQRVLVWNGLSGLNIPAQPPLELEQQRTLAVGATTLTLSQVPAPNSHATQLLLSNDPENISATRGLFHYQFGANAGIRLVYHHKNTASTPLELHLRLSNPSQEEVWVWVSDAWAGPVADEIYAGHIATKRWLELYWGRVGQLVELLPGSQLELSQVVMGSKQVVSGLLEAIVTQGPSAVLDVYAKAPGEDEPPLETYSNGPVYRLGSLETRVQRSYTAGSSLQLSLGEGTFQAGNGKKIRGSWGQLYTYTLELNNPSKVVHSVGLQLTADGGAARGMVWLEGQPIELPLLRPGDSFKLGQFTLPPGAQQTVTLSTLPASGSNYPLRLLLFDPNASDGTGSTP
ncbi:MAG: hypothetical protein IVW51_07900 [Thermaceae bacterium]|nr:hypothetical protein [Thermaceae bacterium]